MKPGLPMKTSLKLSCIVSLFIIIATTSIHAGEKRYTLVFSSHDIRGGSWAKTYEPWFSEIEKRTNGRVKIEAHWGGELVDLAEEKVFGIADQGARVGGFTPLKQILPGSYRLHPVRPNGR